MSSSSGDDILEGFLGDDEDPVIEKSSGDSVLPVVNEGSDELPDFDAVTDVDDSFFVESRVAFVQSSGSENNSVMAEDRVESSESDSSDGGEDGESGSDGGESALADELRSIYSDGFDDVLEHPGASGDESSVDGVGEFDYFAEAPVEVREGELDIDRILSDAIDLNASDVHIDANKEISFTILGDIVHQGKYGVPSDTMTLRCQHSILSHVLLEDFTQELECDASYTIKSGKYAGRSTRLSTGLAFGSVFLVFRIIADVIPSVGELGISDELLSWVYYSRGLVLINGPTGSGKSTTIASMIRHLQLHERRKIITLEKPIEYVYPSDGLSHVTQREIGRDSQSFSNGLKSAMRQAPDLINVGEVRDREEFDKLLHASATGHLAISTMHTTTASGTINRIKSLYDGGEQASVLSVISSSVRGFANQLLLKSPGGKSRVAVREVLSVNAEVAGFIHDGDAGSVEEYQIKHCMTMEHELWRAIRAGKCTMEEARYQCARPFLFDELKNKDF